MIRHVHKRSNPVLEDIEKFQLMHANGSDISIKCDPIAMIMMFGCIASILAESQLFFMLCCVHDLDPTRISNVTPLPIPKSFNIKTISAPFFIVKLKKITI